MRLLRPVIVAVLGAVGVAVAQHNPTDGPAIVGAAAALALVAVLVRERGAAVAALGVGAAAAYVSPDGLGPLLVVTGVVLACDVAAADRRLAPWHHVIEAVVALPALAGIAGSVAAQPSHRGVALGVTAGAVIVGSAWLDRTGRGRALQPSPGATSSVIPVVGLAGAFVVTLAADRLRAFGDLPPATVQASRSVAGGLAVFFLVVVLDAVRAERAAAASARRVSRVVR